MNKKRINTWIPVAKEALEICGVVKDGAVDRGYRPAISAFGAMVQSGGLRAAVAYYCDRGSGAVDRTRVLAAIYYCVTRQKAAPEEVLAQVCQQDSLALKEQFVDASIALKLAIGIYPQR